MIIGYLDASSKNTIISEQQEVIGKYLCENNLKADVIFKDSAIKNALQSVKTESHTIIVANIAVLGVSLKTIVDNIEELMNAKHTVIVVQGDMRFETNVITPKVIDGIRLAVKIRSGLASVTTTQAFDAKEQTGWKRGRQRGAKNRHSISLEYGALIRDLAEQGLTKSDIARRFNISPRSVYNILKAKEQKNV